MKLSGVGVDLAKNVYQLHGADRSGKTLWKRVLVFITGVGSCSQEATR
jgi:hypothetical protein